MNTIIFVEKLPFLPKVNDPRNFIERARYITKEGMENFDRVIFNLEEDKEAICQLCFQDFARKEHCGLFCKKCCADENLGNCLTCTPKIDCRRCGRNNVFSCQILGSPATEEDVCMHCKLERERLNREIANNPRVQKGPAGT